MKNFLTITFLALFSISGMAQNKTEEETKLNQIGIAVGYNHGYIKAYYWTFLKRLEKLEVSAYTWQAKNLKIAS